MKRIGIALLLVVFWSIFLRAQSQPASGTNHTLVPKLVPFSGMATDVNGKPLTGILGITFSIYQDQQGGAPLWIETQNVSPSSAGRYNVKLGATKSDGIPVELFSSGQARWIGVQVQGQPEQPRVLLLSVPYALKAADAETVGGLPPSAFMLAPQAGKGTNSAGRLNKVPNPNPNITGSGTPGYIALWTSSSNLGNSSIFQNAGNIGVGTTSPLSKLDVNGGSNIRGNQTVTGSVDASSYTIKSISFAFGSYPNQNAFLGFAGNATMTGWGNTATGVKALLTNTTGNNNTASGEYALQSNTQGSYNTATGMSALAYNVSSSYNTATGYHALNANTACCNTADGFQALSSNNTGQDNTASGSNALQLNTTGRQNTAIGSLALTTNLIGTDNTASGFKALNENTACCNTADGSQALMSNTAGYLNTAMGYSALNLNTGGYSNTGIGAYALLSNNSGAYNTATGESALTHNVGGNYNTALGYSAMAGNTYGHDNAAMGFFALNGNNGSYNTATGNQALQSNFTGSYNTGIGYHADVSQINLTNATAVGAYAAVGQSNSLVLGGTGQWAVKVGIGTTTPSNVFTIAQGAGHAIADRWDQYSSRRWKTNIHTLHDALAKVQQLRGVTYDLKATGEHEVGVIAEEVGAVVPEVVTWDKNGKDAQGVDYGRLTALLIEATKEQQLLIRKQQKQIKLQHRLIVQLSSNVNSIRASLDAIHDAPGTRIVKSDVSIVRQ